MSTPPGRPRKHARPVARGAIRRGEVYPLAELRRRLGIEQSTIKTLKELGLPVIRIGRIGVVRGSDFCELVDRLADTTKRPTDAARAIRAARSPSDN